jgi:hypothetical protein
MSEADSTESSLSMTVCHQLHGIVESGLAGQHLKNHFPKAHISAAFEVSYGLRPNLIQKPKQFRRHKCGCAFDRCCGSVALVVELLQQVPNVG